MYAEVARVLRPGGLYISQHKQPGSLQSSMGTNGLSDERGYCIDMPQVEGLRLADAHGEDAEPIREQGTAEFSHSLEAILGGLCNGGFVIEAFVEPPRGDALAPVGSPEHRASFLPPYLKMKARRM